MSDNLDSEWGEPVSGQIHDFEANGPLIGVYRGYKEVMGTFGLSKLHAFDTDEGPTNAWGKTHMDRLLEGRIGELVRITLTGKKIPTKAGSMVEYELRSKGRQTEQPSFPEEPS